MSLTPVEIKKDYKKYKSHTTITILKIEAKYKLKCDTCEHEWTTRGDRLPINCPNCKKFIEIDEKEP